MGVTKTTIKEGSGAIPQVGSSVTIEYTGWLKDTSKPDSKGNKYALPLLPLPTVPVDAPGYAMTSGPSGLFFWWFTNS